MILEWISAKLGQRTLDTILKKILEIGDRWALTDGRLDKIESRLDAIELTFDKARIQRLKSEDSERG